jgi:hypothetical protein
MTQGMSRANHLGLFSEELDKSGRQLGISRRRSPIWRS